MLVQHFFDTSTNTFSYIVYDQASSDAVIIDSVLDFDPISLEYSTNSADLLIDFIKQKQLNPLYILETHLHADHLTASQYLKKTFTSAKSAVSERITEVQDTFNTILDLNVKNDGSQFDVLLTDEAQFEAGSLNIKVINTPGHTPACLCFIINESVLFAGDTVFYPEFGTGRCDFPGGSAEQMYSSIKNKIYSLNPSTVIYVGHDYPPASSEPRPMTTVADQMQKNIHIKADTTKDEFIAFRTQRDQQLKNPRLLFQSVQFNMNGGEAPINVNEARFFKLPLLKAKK